LIGGKGQGRAAGMLGSVDAASKPFPARRKAKQSLIRAKNCLFDENYSLFQFTGNLLVTL
jgi:hypothetical protein